MEGALNVFASLSGMGADFLERPHKLPGPGSEQDQVRKACRVLGWWSTNHEETLLTMMCPSPPTKSQS